MITKIQPAVSAGIRKTEKNAAKTQIFAITSGKGGVGKTTISVNMAIDMQKAKKRVLLVDADLHLGNVDLILGTRTMRTIAEAVRDDLPLSEIIMHTPMHIDVLPASSASLDLIESENRVLQKLASGFKNLQHEYDYIIVDTGAGIAVNVLAFLMGADKIALVITPDPASITDAYAVIKVVKSIKRDLPIYLTSNMVNHQDEGDILYKKLNLMVHKFLDSQIFFGGSIIRDELVARSVKNQRPFVLDHPNSLAAMAIRALNHRLQQRIPEDEARKANLFERILETKKSKIEWKL